MGNWRLARWQEPKTLTRDVLREMRRGRPAGMSRRTLIRRSIGAGVTLWLLEVTGGILGFLWPNLSRGFGGTITLGAQADIAANPAIQGAALNQGAPAYYSLARTYFFFQAEDGIRDLTVTGVQTCALPISGDPTF